MEIDPMPIRVIAEAIAISMDRKSEAATDALHQMFRGWFQRGLLKPQKNPQAGRTTAKTFPLTDACRLRFLTLFREFFGTTGDELRKLDAEMRAEERKALPNGRHLLRNLDACIDATLGEVRTGKKANWVLAVVIGEEDGNRQIGCRFSPASEVRDPLDPRYVYPGKLVGFLKIPASDLLRPLLETLIQQQEAD